VRSAPRLQCTNTDSSGRAANIARIFVISASVGGVSPVIGTLAIFRALICFPQIDDGLDA